MTDRSVLVAAIQTAGDGTALAQAVASLDAHDRHRAASLSAERDLDLSAQLVTQRLTPVPLHEHHTAATDWLGDDDLMSPDGAYRTAMIAEASVWYSGLDQAVREDRAELGDQARGRARTLASAYGHQAGLAEREFLQMVGYLHQGASGLPQIDQTVDPNNAPSQTPYPTEVFPTFGEEQDPFNGTETNNHQSGAASSGAPLIQQVEQQNASGSGFGTGPERPDQHDTGFDTSNSYAEVPLGPPGQIPATPAATDQMASSHPNPVAGTNQDAGSERRPTVAHIEGYSLPDPFGYRWPMTAEIMHPFHERCASAHWPDESCGNRSHTASVAVGYMMNLDQARHQAGCEAVGVREGLRAVTSAPSLADLGNHHNRFAAAWNGSGRSADDTAVLHGYMAVVRPVLAELGQRTARSCAECASGNCQNCQGGECSCTRCKNKKEAARQPAGKATAYIAAMVREYQPPAPPGSGLDFNQPGVRYRTADLSTQDAVAGMPAMSAGGDMAASTPGAEEQTAGNVSNTAPMGASASRREGASGLTQVQQVTDANNAPSPQDDQLPEGVMFPIGEGLAQQWVTGPDGPQPRGAKEAARQNGLPTRAAEMFGRMDAMDGRKPQHKDAFAFSKIQHGRYLGGWNETAGLIHGMVGRAPMSRDDYATATGRPDLHAHYLSSYAQGRKMNSGTDGPYAGQQATAGLQVRADTWTSPHQTTDDQNPPYNSPATAPQPPSTNMDPHAQDFAAGQAAGRSDKAAGSRPAFADNSSGVSPYVKGYATGYGAPEPQGAQDVPGSLGGDSGQGMNVPQAQQAFQVARASLAFAPAELFRQPEFSKGYLFASKWQRGARLVSAGSALFEAGLYAGITDSAPVRQQAWLSAHAAAAGSHPQLGRRIALHRSFTRKQAARGMQVTGAYVQAIKTRRYKDDDVTCWKCGDYLRREDADPGPSWAPTAGTPFQHKAADQAHCDRASSMSAADYKAWARDQKTAGVTTDLITDGPGTSPDPMGATPLNGPGTAPAMGGYDNANAPGGSSPYQGAPPLPGGPVVPDDVMGQPQQPPQPSGPFTNTFSGNHPENTTLAPVAPNSADQPGYSNKNAYSGSPLGGDRTANLKLAEFRRRVQAGLVQMGAPA
jgi:hypothetical protein